MYKLIQKIPFCFLSSFSFFRYTNVFSFGSFTSCLMLSFFSSPSPLSACLELVSTLQDSTHRPLSQWNLKFNFTLCIPIMPLLYLYYGIYHTVEWHWPGSEVRLCKAGKWHEQCMLNALDRAASRWHRLFWELLTCVGKQGTLKQLPG